MLDPALAEAAATLGARPATYWRRVGLPLLAPSLVETASLLFANAAAAYATPFALAGTASPVLAVRIAAAVSGDIFSQPELATALSLVMAVLLLVVIVGGPLVGRSLEAFGMSAARGRPKQARSRLAGQAAGRRVHQ